MHYTSLKYIALPEGISGIGPDTFGGCRSLESIVIPDGVTSIEHNTFYDCDSLSSITISASVQSVGYTAFYRCSLEEIHFGGTMEQWETIDKAHSRNRGTGGVVIHCSNGDLREEVTDQ